MGTPSWMEVVVAADLAYEIVYRRLMGLLEGRYEEAFCGETFAMLARCWGAGGLDA